MIREYIKTGKCIWWEEPKKTVLLLITFHTFFQKHWEGKKHVQTSVMIATLSLVTTEASMPYRKTKRSKEFSK